jgi:hypothetical protein
MKKTIFWITANSPNSQQTKVYFFTSRKASERQRQLILSFNRKTFQFTASSITASLVSKHNLFPLNWNYFKDLSSFLLIKKKDSLEADNIYFFNTKKF